MNRLICVALLWLMGCSLAFASQAVVPEPTWQVRGKYIHDPVTNLLWTRCSHGQQWDGESCRGHVELIDLAGARQWAATLGAGWRIPTLDELGSLLRRNGRIDQGLFPGVVDHGEGEAAYWSTSLYEGMGSMVIYLDMFSGRMDVHSPGFALGALAVRDAVASE